MQKLIYLFLLMTVVWSCDQGQVQELSTQVEQLKVDLAKAEENLAAATSAKNDPGLIHSVFFWLKEDISPEDEKAFLEGVNSLRAVSTIKNCYIGPPAPTEARNVVDNTYSYALIVHFDDVAGQDAYQIDPIHLKFVEDHKDKWTKVIVYDNTMLEE
jgi:hypothetical protein